jgi:hypothetical protein
LFEVGRQQFAVVCAQCHRPDGMGQEGKAPPLVGSPWVLGPDRRVIRIVLHGARGPFPVRDRTFNLDMPSLKALTDDQIAGVLTYVRRSWGHEAPPVDPRSGGDDPRVEPGAAGRLDGGGTVADQVTTDAPGMSRWVRFPISRS